jgi:hypothetical protein
MPIRIATAGCTPASSCPILIPEDGSIYGTFKVCYSIISRKKPGRMPNTIMSCHPPEGVVRETLSLVWWFRAKPQ